MHGYLYDIGINTFLIQFIVMTNMDMTKPKLSLLLYAYLHDSLIIFHVSC